MDLHYFRNCTILPCLRTVESGEMGYFKTHSQEKTNPPTASAAYRMPIDLF